MRLPIKISAKLRSLLLYPFQFRKYGKGSLIYSPVAIDGKSNIEIGDKVTIQEQGWIAAMPLTGNTPLLSIGDGTVIGHFCHIYATKSIRIGENVLMADRVYVSDNLHTYEDVNVPVIKQGIKQCEEVEIGEGSWIGENVCVIGAKVGRHCVIGANAVVTEDIPDYSVAVGMPAKVIKKYNPEKGIWERI
jgi:acetyltransferase-like isoleucine patch superfamily enzyme